jgi:endonuclease IV
MQSFDAKLTIGFSTGALALGDWRRGLEMSRALGVNAVELSALRLNEFEPMVAEIKALTFHEFSYVSVHLPSAYGKTEEAHVLKTVESIADKGWPLILHPDVVQDWDGWRNFGALICLENMDKRKPIGRTVEELSDAFERLPEAKFCFDFGHARQIDPTMSQAVRLLKVLGSKLKEIHFSDVARPFYLSGGKGVRIGGSTFC